MEGQRQARGPLERELAISRARIVDLESRVRVMRDWVAGLEDRIKRLEDRRTPRHRPEAAHVENYGI